METESPAVTSSSPSTFDLSNQHIFSLRGFDDLQRHHRLTHLDLSGNPLPANARKIPRFQTTYFLKIRLRTTQTGSEDTGKRIRAADISHKQHIQSTPQSVK